MFSYILWYFTSIYLIHFISWSVSAKINRMVVNWTFSLGVTAEALRANVDWKSALLMGVGLYIRAKMVRGGLPLLRENLTETDQCTVFIQRNFVADFLQVKCNFRRKTAFLRFWAPGRATYDAHLRLIRKRVVNFLARTCQFGLKFQVQWVIPHQPFFVSEN